MPWTYKSPSTFPAIFPISLREAAATSEPQLLATGLRSQIDSTARQFRYFRWCLRQSDNVDRGLEALEANYEIRTSTEKIDRTWFLYLRASPSRIGAIINLNPHLSDIFSRSEN